jgi:hypothetical protein
MGKSELSRQEIDLLIRELVEYHQKQLLKSGRQIISHLTSDDILQPNDFPQLENNPGFRYEEGVLCGIQIVQMALQAAVSQKTNP